MARWILVFTALMLAILGYSAAAQSEWRLFMPVVSRHSVGQPWAQAPAFGGGRPTLAPAATPTWVSVPGVPSGPTGSTEIATDPLVIDGDTIMVVLGSRAERIRYVGMDTPEVGNCYYREASERNRQLVAGRTIQLERDTSNTDRYGRLLRHVWLDQGLVGWILVREGYARVLTISPDTRYRRYFEESERLAQAEGRGLWSACATPAATSTPTPWPGLTPAPTATPLPSSAIGDYAATAWVSDPSPRQRSNVTVYARLTEAGQPVAGATMVAEWAYRTTTSYCSGITGADGVTSCTRFISMATIGYRVVITVTLAPPGGPTLTTAASFTPVP